MQKCYIVEGIYFKDNFKYGKQFYMGNDEINAKNIYKILNEKIEPEYSELTNNENYIDFHIF